MLRPVMLSLTALLLLTSGAGATSLSESLAQAYASNPELASARAQLRSVDEQLPQAQAGFMPQIDASGSIGRSESSFDPGGSTETEPKIWGVDVVQPLYRGGGTLAGIRRARNTIEAQRALLLSAEQQILLNTVVAHLDVVTNEAVVGLNRNNEEVLSRQLEASRDRFRVGEITRTDVSQSESRLAGARANRVRAEGDLRGSEAIFTRITGAPAKGLQPASFEVELPATLDEAIARAERDNPQVIAARFAEAAALDGVDAANAALLPTLSLVASLSRSYDTAEGFDSRSAESVTARLSVPLFQGGAAASRVRAAKQTQSQRLLDIESASREAREGAIRTWESLVAARAAILALEAQVAASQVALEGVRQEAEVGSRTTLDILDAEQELLNAQVDLVRARRNEVVAGYNLLGALGQLTARGLGLEVALYDDRANTDRVDGKFFGSDVD